MSVRALYDADIKTSGGQQHEGQFVHPQRHQRAAGAPHRVLSRHCSATAHPQIGDGAFIVGEGAAFVIDGHSETRGAAKEPQRALINFWVDDVQAERERLEAAGVTFIRKEGIEYWGGVISTFLDPDGNYCQLMSMKGGK